MDRLQGTVILILGILVGLAGTRIATAPRLAALEANRQELQTELAAHQVQIDELESALSEAELARTAALSRLDAATIPPDLGIQEEREVSALVWDTLEPVEDQGAEAAPEESAEDEAPGERRRGRDRGSRDGGGDADREQRFQEFRERMQEYQTKLLDEAPDDATRERLTALMETREYMGELGRQIRETEDEAEREALLEELDIYRENSRNIRTEQQSAMLSTLAEQHGIRGAKDQAAFISKINNLLESPYFQVGGGQRGPGGWGDRGQRGF